MSDPFDIVPSKEDQLEGSRRAAKDDKFLDRTLAFVDGLCKPGVLKKVVKLQSGKDISDKVERAMIIVLKDMSREEKREILERFGLGQDTKQPIQDVMKRLDM